MICRNSVLRKQDLIALRLTSKSHGIHLSASLEFAERHFKEIPLVYTRYSLETFVEICKHSTFGSAVREIQLSYARFLPECFQEESKSLFDDIHGEMESQDRLKYLDKIQLLVNRCDAEEDLEKTGDARDLLAAAFSALSLWNHSLELSVSSKEDRTLGSNRLYISEDPGARWRCDVLGTVALLCRAATLSGCLVQYLRIHGTVWDHLVDSSAYSLSVLSHLPELELEVWSPDHDNLAPISSLEDMFTKLLNHTVGLKILHLDCYYFERYDRCLDKVFSAMTIPGLQKLILSNVDFDLCNPFQKRIETLHQLELYDCRPRGSLKKALLSVQNNFPRLKNFYLSDFLGHEVELEGAQGINDRLNELIHSEAGPS